MSKLNDLVHSLSGFDLTLGYVLEKLRANDIFCSEALTQLKSAHHVNKSITADSLILHHAHK